jgi:hypothetical protein
MGQLWREVEYEVCYVGTYPHGLIFTGMEDGSFKLWNPQEMIATYPNRSPPSLENIEQEGVIIY